MAATILEMKGITKTFPGVKALEDVNFKVDEGEIHALIGENGAGKSTLMKVLSGVHPYGTYAGDIVFQENRCEFKSINGSEDLGIVIIHQELALIPDLSIAENIFLGNENAKKGIINWNKTIMDTRELLGKVGLKVDPQEKIKNIGVGQQQLVEIAKALSKEVKLLILDEPTAALNEEDSENLLQLLLEFKKQGMTSIMISHKLNELFKVADSITVIRDGQTVNTYSIKKDKVTENKIIKDMVGRDLSNLYPERKNNSKDEVVFEIKDWSVYHAQDAERQVLNNVNINVKRGEIVGIAGLMGAGRTELAMSVFGKSYGRKISGQLFKEGKEVTFHNVSQAIEHGIAYVSENRKEYGLILIDSVKDNLTLANLNELSKKNIVDSNKEAIDAEMLKSKINIKTPSIQQKTVNLSGGNQQKVVLGKWIYTDPDILILDEPTRGIDVGAKLEIYKVINELAEQGKSIILISSELPELLGMCDRIYTLSEGEITGDHDISVANQESLMKYMTQSRRS
ncbi:putative multiple sugar transport system ATP-binding protein [Virgibacillus natechei]|uniref:Multiple sugar transport system ATP-binding protein n=1 Tax=Virgibacillus natechei TaxID=1216297 RepID=A0ABS4IG33_9BACI|nr:multiple monosaccharide ABC transporter ATP-binding protein [Virgibacillus natechei]MBP1969291.1 putative multiple sugar transport system ATP-binding protein [Virgibacillus natechei]UZD12446.1 sugar ABC transporter ATP-binding protein [Virgibacillus natechei]